MAEDSETCSCFARSLERRTALKMALGLVVGFPFVHVATAQDNARSARPQEGDLLAFAEGVEEGRVIAPGDLAQGGPRVMAFPLDPRTRLVRDGSRLNKLLLVRLDPAGLDEETRGHAADGIVAYSAICTHQGCDVMAWDGELQSFWCPCHDSKFDPRDGGRVVNGPAPRRLPALPVKIADGVLMAAGGFSGHVGPKTR
jgi:rieske iron-sulfur protein